MIFLTEAEIFCPSYINYLDIFHHLKTFLDETFLYSATMACLGERYEKGAHLFVGNWSSNAWNLCYC